ncbi:glycosyltransferase family 2 protein [Mucilaginibacter glaciei]|uniref:Glycosyltransferase family 2 protein n=1 Tax=Mucilaginibacter glaciei TaxID=2772109 RepID=A0A926NSU4_9SPHI|nr:glycosyltransferase family 2 protein [Mucilaginibacter glaciei]MBD1393330.1 glycosyltransferase family 2 protein [Mucilaginibacter glaciei]
MPKVSVILPVYNGAAYIHEAVTSVLAQSFSDFDLFVIDDGSTDNTLDVLQQINDKRLKITPNDANVGLINTLNRGLNLSAGYKYVARMDADDICLPGRLAATVNVLDSHPAIGVAGTSVTYFGEGLKNKDVILPATNERIVPALMCRNPIIHPSVMIRNEVLLNNNLQYDSDYYKYEDYKLWLDLINKCEFYNTHEIHFMYRRHSNNVTNVGNYNIADDLDMMNQILTNYANALQFEFTPREIYIITIIASTYRWRADTTLPLGDIIANIRAIIDKHSYKNIDSKYLTELLWERVFIYLLKTKRLTDFLTLIVKLGTTINYNHIMRIYNNWY